MITLILSSKKINIINLILFQNIVLINLNYKYCFLKKSHYVIGVEVKISDSDSDASKNLKIRLHDSDSDSDSAPLVKRHKDLHIVKHYSETDENRKRKITS